MRVKKYKIFYNLNNMDNIIEPNESFDFSKISLGHPVGIQGGAYFTKILFDKVCTEVVLTCSNPPTALPSCKNNKFLSVSTISSASAPTNVEVLAVLPLRNRNSVDMLIFILGHGTKIY